MKPQAILVSACLLGLPTRYDGRAKHNQKALDYLRQCGMIPVPVCPEQLAGLATPRPMTFFACGDGTDVLDGCLSRERPGLWKSPAWRAASRRYSRTAVLPAAFTVSAGTALGSPAKG
jgi:hypothetical protein